MAAQRMQKAKKMSKELEYVRGAAAILKLSGRVEIGYITAELEPWSAQQKPDISFVPEDGPNAGGVFFVEIRLFDDGELPRGYAQALKEHRAFAMEGADCEYAGFALATDAKIGADVARELAADGVQLLGRVDSAQMLADKIIEWAGKSCE